VCRQDITLTETRDGKDRLHLYFITYEQIPDKQVDNAPEMIDKKDANLAPSIEVKGSCKKLIYPTPNRGYHPLSPIEIVDFSKGHSDLINHISEICQKYGLRYIKDLLAYDQYAQYDILNDVSLTDSDIQKIANLWVPYYKSGNRHDISVGTIGLYAKNGLTAITAKRLSLELSRITKDDQTRLIDLTVTYSRLSQNKSIKSVALLEPIIGDNLGPILSKFHNILRCYKRAEQDFDQKLIHNGSNIRSQSNDRRHDTPFVPDPMLNRAVGKPDISNIKILSTDNNSEY